MLAAAPRSLIDMLALRARTEPGNQHGSAIACECHYGSFTYDQLNQLSDHLAHKLLDQGAKPGDRIGICMPKSTYAIASILSVLKIGATYLPLDPEYPDDRLATMIDDAQLAVLMVASAGPPPAPEVNVRRLIVEPSAIDTSAPNPLPQVDTASAPAYMIYTSGSTGKPKGVLVGHRAAINFVEAMLATPGFTADDVLLSASTLAFDISVYDVFVPLAAGGKIVIVDREIARDGKKLAESIARSGATLMFATPSGWRMLIESGWQGTRDRFRAFTGGEHLPRELIQPLLDRTRQLWNFYGPTEAAVLVTRQQNHRSDRTDLGW